jgi:hypothetical protein
MSARTDGDAAGFAILIAVGLAVLFVLSPYLSIRAADGQWGGVLTVVGVLYLGLSTLAPALPQVGKVIGFQWTLFVMWSAGYFSWANAGMGRVLGLSTSGEGLDGLLLSIGVLTLGLLYGIVAFLLVPGGVAVAGGLLFNCPGLLTQRAWELGANARSALDVRGDQVFNEPRWGGAHHHRADRILRRRRRLGSAAATGLAVTGLLAVAVVLGPAQDKVRWLAPLWVVALIAAGLWNSTRRAIVRDAAAWALVEDRFTRQHASAVAYANAWAAAVHPDDLRDGRPVIQAILADSLKSMYRAQDLTVKVEQQREVAGPGWTPPSQADLDEAVATLSRAERQLGDVWAEAETYRASTNDIEAAQRADADRRRSRDDLAIIEAATGVYMDNYVAAWEVLDGLGASGGLPEPDHLRRDSRTPAGVPAADLPESLEAIAGQERGWGDHDGWRAAVQRLRSAAAVTRAAAARLALVQASPSGPVALDGDRAQDLITHIRARTMAEREAADAWPG